MVEEQQVVEVKQVTGIDLFDPIRAGMAIARKENEILVFDYEDPAGEKAARSHIQTLRHIKTAIAAAHKEAKASILVAGREIDGLKNELTGEVEGWIGHHFEPIQRIQRAREEAEAEELRKIQEADAKKEADRLADLERREADVKAAEEKVAREEAEKLAEENARKAEAERIEREKRIAEEAEAKARAEWENQQAINKAAAEANRKTLEEAERKRQANKKHRAKIENEIDDYPQDEVGLAPSQSAALVVEMANGTIPHVRIEY